MRGSTIIPARFGMRPVDGHRVRPQELGPIYLDKRQQGTTCVLCPEYLLGSSEKLLCVGNGCVLETSPW